MLRVFLFLALVIIDDLLFGDEREEISEAEHFELVRASRAHALSREDKWAKFAQELRNAEPSKVRNIVNPREAHGALAQSFQPWWGCE